ncbi:13450_t:CDS:2 [Gigaspora margarita]|uniref:13450_t:CDS:1 n=1 Tax=Gigaspora margarita TaxID=4874 RepID=A0ABN7VK71_GIGMA|nr:13450_t:CDS:2 [Gigaspora margarita]
MNNKQFQKFMELMIKAQRVGNELSDIKKRIKGLALNYTILSAKLKDTESNRLQESIYRRYNQNNYKWEKKKELNVESFCKLEDTNDEEIYIVNNITFIKATKRLANSKWEDRLQKIVRVPQKKEIEEPDTNDPIIIQNLLPLKNLKKSVGLLKLIL